jgi:hypothetical protein
MNQLGPPSLLGQHRRNLSGQVRRELAGMVEPGWTARAWCVGLDGDAFFRETSQPIGVSLRQVCAECPVRRSCLASALLVGEYGIWAGTSRQARQAVTRTRLAAGEDPAGVVEDLLAAAVPAGWPPRPGRVWSGKGDAA